MSHSATISVALPTLAALIGVGALAPASAQTAAPPTYELAETTVVVAPNAPPPPQTELVPRPPKGVGQAVWQLGHWQFSAMNGGTWVWMEGHWT